MLFSAIIIDGNGEFSAVSDNLFGSLIVRLIRAVVTRTPNTIQTMRNRGLLCVLKEIMPPYGVVTLQSSSIERREDILLPTIQGSRNRYFLEI